MPKYSSLNIGPIYNTLKRAQKTRMVWAASYFFCYIVKKIAADIYKTHPDSLIIPFSNNDYTKGSKYGAGNYPDRMLFKKLTIEEIKSSVDIVLIELAKDICRQVNLFANNIDKKKYSEMDVFEYLKNYLQITIIEKDIENNTNIVQQLYPIIYCWELRNKFMKIDEDKIIFKYLYLCNKQKRDSVLPIITTDAFMEEVKWKNKQKRFDSLIEISTRGLSRMKNDRENANTDYLKLVRDYIEDSQQDDTSDFDKSPNDLEEDQVKFIKELKNTFKINNNETYFRAYHKYVAVVYADGDKIGQLLNDIGNDADKLKEFSKALIDFSNDAEQLTIDYGGSPIYIGGEDILLFLPVAIPNENGLYLQNIFNLLQRFDLLFDKHFAKLSSITNIKPTLSYGIHIGYYKQPLIEMMKSAKEQLESFAKNITITDSDKNAIAINLEKHTNSNFNAVIQKKHISHYNLFINNIYDLTYQSHLKDSSNDIALFTSSFAHKLGDNVFEALLDHTLSINDKSRLEDFIFEKMFNESIHKKEENQKKLILIINLIWETYITYSKDIKKTKEIVYTALRLAHFINSNDKEE